MKRKWKKLGQIYKPRANPSHAKLHSHAANPLPIHIENDVYRVFFSARDQHNRSSVGAVDIDVSKRKIVFEHELPFFEYGSTGSFYSDGVSIGNCYEVSGIRYMLFMGWQNPAGSHWRGDIGRLIVNEDLTLSLDSQEPFMGIDSTDPLSLSYPWVAPRVSSGFDMWYGSTLTWDAGNGEMLHVIQHAFSEDGDNWQRNGTAIPFELGKAQAFSRPTVMKNETGDFEMWFSFRSGTGENYRIGYAHSLDGQNWTLELENAGIDVSDCGWDSEMIEYPFVFDHKGSRYMLYNGNGFGKTGFGLAVLE